MIIQYSIDMSIHLLQSLISYAIISEHPLSEGIFMATVSLTIRIDENDKKAIEQLAKKDDRSISYIVNQAIKAYLNANDETEKK